MTTQMKGNSSMSNLLWLWSTINLPSEKEDSCSPRANHNNGNNNRNNPSPLTTLLLSLGLNSVETLIIRPLSYAILVCFGGT